MFLHHSVSSMLKKWFCCNGCVRCDEFSVCEPFQLIANRRCNSFTLMVFMNKQPIQNTCERPEETFLQRRHTYGQQNMKRCSISLIIREIQIKTTKRYHSTPVRITIITKSTNNKCWRVRGKKGTLRRRWWECKSVQPLWRFHKLSRSVVSDSWRPHEL